MEELIRQYITDDCEENLKYVKQLFKDNSDIVYREFNIGMWKAALVYIDGMSDKILLDDYVLESLMLYQDKIQNVNEIKEKILTVTDLKEEKSMSSGIESVLSGETMMFVDGLSSAFIIATRAWQARSVSEPSSETVIRGARDGFTETIRFNTALVRRRIRDTRLRSVHKTIGTRSKTDVVVEYIDDIVNKDVLEQLNSRLDKIKIDAILDSGYLEQLIEDNKWSIFPQVQSTERPDVVASALYEGRVAVLVDNSPVAIIVPATLPNLLQSPDDYYQRWIHGSFIRIIRFIGVILSLISPAFYVAVTSFHTSIIPTKLAYSIAASREGVPFPAYVEAIIMELSLDLLIESVLRLPKPIGSTIGIVGGLIIGQAAVTAGIVSPIMIIIVSITAITSFMLPNYEVTSAFRIMRLALIIAASIIGFYGIMLLLILLVIHLVYLKSFGISYLAPMVTPKMKDFKDMYLRFPTNSMKERPQYMKTQDKVRQK